MKVKINSISELNKHAIGVPEVKEEYDKRGQEEQKKIFVEIMAENLPNLIKTINSQIQEA